MLDDPELVRAAAERAKDILREGGDPAPIFVSLLQTPTLAAAEARAAHLAGQVWDWDQARDAFLAACRKGNRPDTVRSYRSASGLIDLALLKGGSSRKLLRMKSGVFGTLSEPAAKPPSPN